MGSYVFMDSKTNKPAVLAKVDDEICAKKGITPDAVEFSESYDLIVMIGIGASMHTGQVTKQTLDDYFARVEISAPNQALAREFLTERYQFDCWR